MRVFVLNVGRCGSKTFSVACKRITNYTAKHEGAHPLDCDDPDKFLEYPDNHIEVDNRLIWFLPTLYELYPSSYWVHLTRNLEASMNSLPLTYIASFWDKFSGGRFTNLSAAAKSYWTIGNRVISDFLLEIPDGLKSMIKIEDPIADFITFWSRIDAEGDMETAIHDLGHRYNKSIPGPLKAEIVLTRPA